jgi:cytochrome c oxidase assembly factor CtaG
MSPPLMNLFGLVVETLLHGIYFVLFPTSTYLLVARYKSSRASWKYVPLLCSMVFLSGFCLFAAVSGVRRTLHLYPALYSIFAFARLDLARYRLSSLHRLHCQ